MPIQEQGYLDNSYLVENYMSGQVDDMQGVQIEMITSSQKVNGVQVNQVINETLSNGVQLKLVVNSTLDNGSQVEMITENQKVNGLQVQLVINKIKENGIQAELVVSQTKVTGSQVLMSVNKDNISGTQLNLILTNQLKNVGVSVNADKLRHALCELYLMDGYLENDYLSECMEAFEGVQIEMFNNVQNETGTQIEGIIYESGEDGIQVEGIINKEFNEGVQTELVINYLQELGLQIERIINKSNLSGTQIEMIINDQLVNGIQVDRVNVLREGSQVTMVIYNATQLRFMWEFPSRGTEALGGNNWVASSTATGDFLSKNLNTDIVEQVWRSNGVPSFQTLVCDTGIVQGVSIDTIAILNHNFTKSAFVQVQGSNDNFASAPNITFNMVVTLENMYYISPTFPPAAGQNRYWKFIIQDVTNPDGYLQVGTILFGTSEMFNLMEMPSNPIRKSKVHFKDSIQTEGFTNVSNDRALKTKLGLTFERINYHSGNFRILDEIMNVCRTSLKVLVIPQPQNPERYAVYGKLDQIPDTQFTYINDKTEYVEIEMNFDEAL